jgi:hypothetical protein
MVAAMLSTVTSIYICYLNFDAWKLHGMSFAWACGFRLDNAFTVIPGMLALMTLFYLGPLVTYLMLLSVSRHYEVGYDGSLRERSKPVSMLTCFWKLLMRYAAYEFMAFTSSYSLTHLILLVSLISQSYYH